MIRKLRTERDGQQWMLDLALNMRGRVQNFERDDLEVPAGTRATGGGYDTAFVTVLRSAPSPSGDAWLVMGRNDTAKINILLDVYAICLRI